MQAAIRSQTFNQRELAFLGGRPNFDAAASSCPCALCMALAWLASFTKGGQWFYHVLVLLGASLQGSSGPGLIGEEGRDFCGACKCRF